MNKRLLGLLLAGLLLVSGLAAMPGAAQPDERTADATVETHYVQTDAESTDPRVYIWSDRFDNEDVVEYGVEPEGASVTYDRGSDGYVLHPNETGTHDVYWVVEQTRTVTDGNDTRTETTEVRYTQSVQADANMGGVVVDQEEYSDLRSDADHWREVNSTANHLANRNFLLQFSDHDSRDVIEKSFDAYVFLRSPLSWFTGGATAYIILVISSLGAAAILIGQLGYHTAVVAWLYRQLNLKESTEAHEGSVAERTEALELKESEQALQNEPFNSVWPHDDAVADAFRELGENPHEAYKKFSQNVLPPSLAAAEKLRAMGQCGYTAVVDERTSTDGGEEGSEQDDDPWVGVTDAHVEDDDSLDEDTETAPLTEVTRDIARNAFDLNDPTIVEWSRDDHDYDEDKAALDAESMSLQDLISETQLDDRHFDSETAAGEYLLEFLQHVRQHPYTTDDGAPDTTRAVLEEWLRTAQYLRDRCEFPGTQFQIDVVEQAIINYDPEAEARQTLDDIRGGRYA